MIQEHVNQMIALPTRILNSPGPMDPQSSSPDERGGVVAQQPLIVAPVSVGFAVVAVAVVAAGVVVGVVLARAQSAARRQLVTHSWASCNESSRIVLVLQELLTLNYSREFRIKS